MSYIGNSPATSTQVADNAITLAKMAHGTDGELITYDATGAPANVAVGTSGQVLTSGGAGVAPTFQAAAGGGKVLQVVDSLSGAYASTSAVIPLDNTTPQSTEGVQLYSLAITPSSATSKLYIEANVQIRWGGTSDGMIVAIFKDSDANALATTFNHLYDGHASNLRLKFSVASSSTTARTYKLRVGAASAITYQINGIGVSSGARLNGTLKSGIIITEVEA